MTIFSLVHEGDSMDEFFWSALGFVQSPDDGTNLRGTFIKLNFTGGHTGIAVTYAIPGSRIQANVGDLVDRAPVLDALVDTGYPRSIGSRLNVNADSRLPRKWILSVQIGTNPDSVDPNVQLTRAGNYCLARAAAGWKVILATIPSRTDGINGALNFDLLYAQPYNAAIKAPGWAAAHGVAAIADIASAPELGGTDAANNPTYFYDKIHVTNAGAAAGGPILRAAIDGIVAFG